MNSYSLMRFGGIRIVVDPTWIFMFLLVVVSLGGDYFPDRAPHVTRPAGWLLAVVGAVLLFVSVLVHELSHAWMAKRAGIQAPRIRLFLFGGISEMAAEAHSPGAELRIAAAGPLTSLGLALVSMLAARTLAGPEPTSGRALLAYLAAVNLGLALFNLLPGLPLDGGRMLRAWLWSHHGNLLRATRTAGRCGMLIGILLMGLGLASLAIRGYMAGLWLILVGFFLQRSASTSYEMVLLRDRLAGVRVRQLMTREVDTVPDHISLDELAREHFFRFARGAFPVMNGSTLAGMVSIGEVRRVPHDEWVRTPVRQVMSPVERVPPVGPEDDCLIVLERMIREDVSPLAVVQSGRVVGILSRRDILQQYRNRSAQGA